PPGTGTLLHAGTGSGRTVTWMEGLRLIRESPWVGHGYSTTSLLFPTLRNTSLSGLAAGNDLHNSYLEAAFEMGIAWAALLTGLLLAPIVRWLRRRRRGLVNDDQVSAVAAALIAGLVGGMVEAIFESGITAAGGLLAFPVWLFAATLWLLSDRPL